MKSLRILFRNYFLSLLGSIKRPSNSIHILNGHYISKENFSNDYREFENLLQNLVRYFTFVKFEDACELISNKTTVDKPILAFTFDDGFKCCYDIIAPLLEKYNTNGAFFINPGVIESDITYKKLFLDERLKMDVEKDFLTWEQIKDLKRRGHIIGNHTHNHANLIILSEIEIAKEIEIGKKILEDKLGYECDYFALTYGTPSFFDDRAISIGLLYHKKIFTSYEYESYFYKKNINVLARRHFEGSWPISHLKYFTSIKRVY
jgi:peptidoglycan/xylan/chitin deacetylase (PgdA/CDA1 family)